MEYLTREIAREYRQRAAKLPPNGLQDIGHGSDNRYQKRRYEP